MPIDSNRQMRKVLFVLPFLSVSFISLSYGRIIENIDKFSGVRSIRSITDNTTTNRVMLEPQLNMAFKEVIFKKDLMKNKTEMGIRPSQNKEILKNTLKTLEYLTNIQKRFAASGETHTSLRLTKGDENLSEGSFHCIIDDIN